MIRSDQCSASAPSQSALRSTKTGLGQGSGPPARLANAVVSYLRYIGKTLWPSSLAVFYPHPGADLPTWQVGGAVLVLAAITTLAVVNRRRRPWLFVGWFWSRHEAAGELSNDGQLRNEGFVRLFLGVVKFVTPVLVFVVLLNGLGIIKL